MGDLSIISVGPAGFIYMTSLYHCVQRAFKRETEVENWIQKYDNEVGEKQVQY